MRKIFIVQLFILTSTFLFAQDLKYENYVDGIYVNFLGDASIISINYERIFLLKDKLKIASKIGLGYNTEISFLGGRPESFQKYLTLPHSITCNIGGGKEFLEFGIGGNLLFNSKTKLYIPYPLIGYRLQSLEHHRSYIRIYLSLPLTGWGEKEVFFSPFVISIGKSI